MTGRIAIRERSRSIIHQVAVMLMSATLALLSLTGCQQAQHTKKDSGAPAAGRADPEKLMVVDCLLPGRIQKLGQKFTYITPRRPIKTSAEDCEIRGGEYTAYDRADYRTALYVWLDQAKGGDPKAQTYVGEIYEKGMGIAPDYGTAYHWYLKAAEQGYSRARINLGYLYEKGLGVDRDPVEALNWYRKASGLEGDDLAFASSIEVQVASAVQERTARYQRELMRHEKEAAALRRQLRTTRERLQTQKSRVEEAAQAHEAVQEKLQRQQAAADTPAAREQVHGLKQQLARQSARLESQREALARLQAEYEQQQQGLNRELDAAREQQRILRQELTQKTQETDALRRQLNDTRDQMATQQTRVAQANTRLIELEQEIATLRAASETDERKDAELSILTRKLESQKARMEQQRTKLARLETEFSRQQAELETKLAGATRQQQSLLRQLDEKQKESSVLRRQLDDTERRLAGAQSELSRSIEALQIERVNFERAQRELAQSRENKGLIEDMAGLLREKEKALKQQRRLVANLEQQSAGIQRKLVVLDAPTLAAALPGPTIELLDPPIVLTRSMPSVRVGPGVKERLVEARVTAAAGLKSVTVNDRPQAVNTYGVFRTSIPVTGANTAVQIVAVDQHGKRAAIQFTLQPQVRPPDRLAATTRPRDSEAGARLASIDFGNYYALIVGNQKYPHLPDLNTPINDARTLDTLLREKYGFRTTLLLNANRYKILSALNELRQELTKDDNLLIYYAGHGDLDNVNRRGFWLPVDAEPDNNANWISNNAVTESLNAMAAKHVLVIADSCYSGSMTRSAIARLDSDLPYSLHLKWLRVMAKTRSRTVLTSGGVKPVLDAGGGDHSVFARAFLETLQRGDNVLDGYTIYRSIGDEVQKTAAQFRVEQEPRYAPIQYAGHESGEFLFVPIKL